MMQTTMGVWLGRGWLGVTFVLAGCGGATESPLGNAGDAADAGSRATVDSGGGPTLDATRGADVRGATDVTIALDAISSRDTGGPSLDAVSLPDNVIISIDAISPPPNFDAQPPPPIDGGAGCPGAAPMNFSACMTAGLMCDFGTTTCDCAAGMRWECQTCPATQPTTGSMCQGGGGAGFGGAGGLCTYGSTECSCNGGMWSCGGCPATEPANASMCTVAGLSCDFDAGTCRCGAGGMGGGGFGGNEAWRCTEACPATQPDPGATCDGTAAQQCTYGMTVCLCTNGTYFCN
jgi:hypothetical protein